jgi:hypothetical protein
MNPLTAAHLHLAPGQVPIMAILFGLGWLAYGVWRASRDIQKASLGMFVLAAVLVVPLYFAGGSAAGVVKGLPGFSDLLLEQHQAAAGVTLASCLVLGILALAGLILFRGRAVAGWFNLLLLAGALLASSLAIWTASLGGQVGHVEIRAGEVLTE